VNLLELDLSSIIVKKLAQTQRRSLSLQLADQRLLVDSC